MLRATLAGSLFGLALVMAVTSHAQELLADLDFEASNPNGAFPDSGEWLPEHLGEAGAVCTVTAGRTGNGLWLYTGSHPDDWWSGPFQQVEASPGDAFRASAWILASPEAGWVDGSKARLHVSFHDSMGAVLTSFESDALTSANSQWSQHATTTEAAPQDTEFVRFACIVEKPRDEPGQSIVKVDDCSLRKEAIPAIRLSSRVLGIPASEEQTILIILNSGSGPLDWQVAAKPDWLTLNPASGQVAAGANRSVVVSLDRRQFTGTGTAAHAFSLDTSVGSLEILLYVELAPATPPNLPSIVRCVGRQLTVQDRLADGTLSAPYHYVIKGAAWSPASVATLDDPILRRLEFKKWYLADTQLMRAMNANTVYTFLDFGTGPEAFAVLDYMYENGIKVIMTVDENGTANTNRINTIVPAYRDHPAILAWAIGNEWNINLFHTITPGSPVSETDLESAAHLTELLARQVKALDTNHPVVSIFGDIDVSDGRLAMTNIVNRFCPSVDFWGLNVYRGKSFGPLFQDWARISRTPVFLSEYGTDAFSTRVFRFEDAHQSVDGSVDEGMQAEFNRGLWREIAANLSANRLDNVCLGGTAFEWNDEWWKASAAIGAAAGRHDNMGFFTYWNPNAMPDSVANEEWFALVSIDRRPRAVYYAYQEEFANTTPPVDLDQDGLPDAWEYGLVDRDPNDSLRSIVDVNSDDDLDGDGQNNAAEFNADTDPLDAASILRITQIKPAGPAITVEWIGGVQATQWLERAFSLSDQTQWTTLVTNTPPVSNTNQFQDAIDSSDPRRFYRIRAFR